MKTNRFAFRDSQHPPPPPEVLSSDPSKTTLLQVHTQVLFLSVAPPEIPLQLIVHTNAAVPPPAVPPPTPSLLPFPSMRGPLPDANRNSANGPIDLRG